MGGALCFTKTNKDSKSFGFRVTPTTRNPLNQGLRLNKNPRFPPPKSLPARPVEGSHTRPELFWSFRVNYRGSGLKCRGLGMRAIPKRSKDFVILFWCLSIVLLGLEPYTQPPLPLRWVAASRPWECGPRTVPGLPTVTRGTSKQSSLLPSW